MSEIQYYEDMAPGRGTLAPGAWRPGSDAPALSLGGEWAFRLHDRVPQDAEFTGDGFEPETAPGWTTLRVPGHWVLQGHGAPAYTNTRYRS